MAFTVRFFQLQSSRDFCAPLILSLLFSPARARYAMSCFSPAFPSIFSARKSAVLFRKDNAPSSFSTVSLSRKKEKRKRMHRRTAYKRERERKRVNAARAEADLQRSRAIFTDYLCILTSAESREFETNEEYGHLYICPPAYVSYLWGTFHCNVCSLWDRAHALTYERMYLRTAPTCPGKQMARPYV